MATSKAGYGSFAIDKFDGGLNTAVAPSMLNTKFSPDLYNVDFTDTGGLTRRKGYSALTEFPVVAASYTGVAALTGTYATPFLVYEFSPYAYANTITSAEITLTATAAATRMRMAVFRWNGSTFANQKVSYDHYGSVFPADTYKFTFSSPIADISATTRLQLSLGFYGVTSINTAISIAPLVSGTIESVYGFTLSATGMPFNIYGSASKPVNGLYRYYQTDGDRYWMTCYGGKLYANGSGDAPTERVEAESVVVAASSSGISASYPSLSAGRGWRLSASGDTAKFTIPSSSTVTLGLVARATSPNNMSASYRIDSGAWLSATFPWQEEPTEKRFTVSGLSEAAHTLYVKLNNDGISPSDAWYLYADYCDYGTPSAWSTEAIALSATADQFGFATLSDKCYFSSAYDTLRSFDGTTVATVTATGAPAGAFLIEHKRRLWSAGSATDPAKLSYTNVDDPEDWVGGGDMYLAGKDSGGRCTGLIPWRNQIVYFSDSRIYSIDPSGADTSWTASLVGWNAMSTSIGCVAPKSLVQTDNALIFLSADGVRAYGYIPNLYSSDGSGLLDLSENIRPTLDTITEAMKPKAAGAFYDGRYWLSVALDGASVNNAVLVYDIAKAAWTKYTGMSISCFFVTRGDEYGLYAGDAANGKVYRMDYGESDDGAAITMYWKSPQIAPGGFESVKHFRHLHIAAESEVPQALTVGVNTDDVALADQEVSVTANTAAQPLRVEASSRGRSVQYELTSSGAAQPLTVSRLTTTFHSKKVR